MATSIRDFKLHMIRRHLTGKISIHLSPTFLNHMVNEVEEYLEILKYLKTEQMPPLYHELHYHMVWLPDAAGHAGAISDTMDAVEKDIKARSKEYSVHFEQFYIKAVELAGYLRTNLKEFPALKRMNQEVKMEIMLFRKFLKEIEELELSHEVLGTFSALMADHMAREECYYLTKVAMASQTTEPGRNPANQGWKKIENLLSGGFFYVHAMLIVLRMNYFRLIQNKGKEIEIRMNLFHHLASF